MKSKKHDIFPAIVVVAPVGTADVETMTTMPPLPEGAKRLERVRVVVLNGNIMIAEDSPDGPKLMFQEAITQLVVDEHLVKVQTQSNKTIAFHKQEHCGCGSRLRTWNPYGSTMYSTQDPS